MNKQEFIMKLPKIKEVFVVFSAATHVPYVICNPDTKDDEILLYTEEEKAKVQVAAFNEEKKPCQNVRVEKDMLLKFFSELFLYGVNSIRAVSEEDIFNIQLDEIVRRPDTNTPDGKKLLENPQLQLSMLYYMQELRRGLEKINVDEYRDMEEEMIINIMRAKYILPVKEEEEDGKKTAKLMYIKLKNGQSFVPILTDGMEFARFRGKQVDLQARIIDFENMSKMKLPDEVSGFLINPPTANVPVFKKHIEKWLSGFSWK